MGAHDVRQPGFSPLSARGTFSLRRRNDFLDSLLLLHNASLKVTLAFVNIDHTVVDYVQ